jgi:hypothetical protein
VTWLTIVKLVLGVADKMLGYVEDRQLIQAGEARAARAQLKGAMDAIDRGLRARRQPDGVLGDKYDRDKRG